MIYTQRRVAAHSEFGGKFNSHVLVCVALKENMRAVKMVQLTTPLTFYSLTACE